MSKKDKIIETFNYLIDKKLDLHREKVIEELTVLSYESTETDESLKNKAILIQKLMDEGYSIHEACDDESVFICSEDKQYVYEKYILKRPDVESTIEEFRLNRLKLDILRYIEKNVLK